MRVLLVEDDELIAESLIDSLQDEAYAVDWAKDGREAILSVKVQAYDLILLDLGLPHIDGMGVLETLRSANIATPVLILTARDQIKDRVQGLDAGADDYLTKPFAMTELLARMRVLIRRSQGNSHNLLQVADLTLDINTKRLKRAGEDIDITAKEYMLLSTFMNAPDKVFSKAALEDALYNWDAGIESNAIEFLIYGLRKKIGQKRIKNIRGLGWYISADTAHESL